ncbi:urea ABC transporter ATP-binding protein UrtD [Parendozoicomonas haliclonae]|uniref:Lipopolysaccharide export system ATP-binding protein LptB n=1 Tax=Parendozoicomonas haliclonae TaxID=1960125 RepID=A0A1X7AHK5_9GAMM|nr:urea ABC transporter ATP-binding protein UrtD [Parendozoicomonas haliclonae]SMA41677.1 Lipopolysaccharide export system ATP-binding protein LptB [Parendozoicomonas haliclonae]
MVESTHGKSIPDDTLLYLDSVTVSFDGFKALNDLSLLIRKGELRAMIGPNGAGKSTMMDVITGKTRPDEGKVLYRQADNSSADTDLTRFDEAAVANMGIGRKFQKPSVIESLTVWENLELALAGRRSPFATLFHRIDQTDEQKISDTLDLIHLAERRDDLGANLSHGQKQWLEIGMLLLQEPELLLVDEPAAGMTDEETFRTADLLREIARERSVVVVEHDMEFIRALDCRVTVLHEGHVLAEGSLDHVQNNQQVIDVYLGR